jgi:hypothetical protein
MQLANVAQLDTERRALIDRLDAIWMACPLNEAETRTQKRSRVLAIVLAHSDMHSRFGGWIIGPGWRLTAPAVMRA